MAVAVAVAVAAAAAAAADDNSISGLDPKPLVMILMYLLFQDDHHFENLALNNILN